MARNASSGKNERPDSSKRRTPKYRHHKPSGKAFIEIRGFRHYLGDHNSAESFELYARKVAEYHAFGDVASQANPKEPIDVFELADRYLDFADKRYARNPDAMLAQVKRVIKTTQDLYGSMLVTDFGPVCLRAIRQKWIDENLARNTINCYAMTVVRIWKWGVSQELIPAEKWQALKSVQPLAKGEGGKELRKVLPAPLADVEAAIACMSPQCAALVRFQLATACRPDEAIRLRMADVNQGRSPWEWTLSEHKTAHHEGQEIKIILIGPKAQAAISDLLVNRSPEDPVFDAVESMRWWRARSKNVKHGRYHGTKKRDLKPKAFCYGAYRDAVKRACEAAGVPHWKPNQLRHLAATQLRAKYGIEAARLILGHTTANTTLIYAERDLESARRIAESDG